MWCDPSTRFVGRTLTSSLCLLDYRWNMFGNCFSLRLPLFLSLFGFKVRCQGEPQWGICYLQGNEQSRGRHQIFITGCRLVCKLYISARLGWLSLFRQNVWRLQGSKAMIMAMRLCDDPWMIWGFRREQDATVPRNVIFNKQTLPKLKINLWSTKLGESRGQSRGESRVLYLRRAVSLNCQRGSVVWF